MNILRSKRAQNLTELALLVGIVGLVFIGMEVYFRRSMQWKIKGLTDYMIGSEQRASVSDPNKTTSSSSTSLSSTRGDTNSAGGQRGVTVNESSVTTSWDLTYDPPK